MLQSVDIAVAFAASLRAERGPWRQEEVRKDLGLPPSTAHKAFVRLQEAGILRDGHISPRALEALLAALPYLSPLKPDPQRRVRGIPTSFSAPALRGLRYQTPYVWPVRATSLLTEEGIPVAPLHPRLPEAVYSNPELYALFAALDAVRGGRSREIALGLEVLRQLKLLPPLEVHLHA